MAKDINVLEIVYPRIIFLVRIDVHELIGCSADGRSLPWNHRLCELFGGLIVLSRTEEMESCVIYLGCRFPLYDAGRRGRRAIPLRMGP